MTDYGTLARLRLPVGKCTSRCRLRRLRQVRWTAEISSKAGPRYRTIGTSLSYLIRKSSFVSFVPFISARIQFGSIPRPVHLSFLSFLD